ncbi:MAG TPA: histidine phosphatase family protein [Candidatus Nanoarchaeia archaeon]|nr:histidine phosphatase family protein [Candidatus Nanoarchaeia archaeon]
MSFFTSLVNVQSLLKEINHAMSSDKKPAQICSSIDHLRKYILLVEGTHKNSLHPSETVKLREVCKYLESVKAILSSKNADARKDASLLLQKIQRDLESMFSVTSVYMLRHPDKSEDMVEMYPGGPSRKRNLSPKGVRQAKAFAEYLAEEVLLCPKAVNVSIYCSDMRRAWLYGEIIRRKLVQTSAHYGKRITVSEVTRHPDLFFRMSKEAMAEYGPDYKENEFQCFANWMKGKYKLTPNPVKVSSELEAWADAASSISGTGSWNIVIGVSHSFIIDTLLYYKTKNHNAIIGTADYIRFIQNKMGYKGTWYKYTA